jgi:putative transposase
MARPLRLSFENAVYHIIARGNRKEDIFYSDRDRNVFLDKMNETFVKFSFICYANCLMDNHYHLFVKTPLANISEEMHNLNTSYANWFKAKHNIVGVVFQGRYKSILVDEDNYAIVVATYSHVNPVRGGLVKDIEKYKWSSYLDYIGKRKPMVERLDTSFVLSLF